MDKGQDRCCKECQPCKCGWVWTTVMLIVGLVMLVLSEGCAENRITERTCYPAVVHNGVYSQTLGVVCYEPIQ